MLGEMAREAQNFLNPRHEVFCQLPGACQTLLLKTVGQFSLPIPPGQRARQLIDKAGIKPHRFADIAHRTARPVGDDRCGQRRAAAAVLFIDVLNHLLAPLMLEVHINIRWLIPLPRDESLEQQRHLLRGDLGDVQAVAHDRVGSRASALTEDVA